MRQISSNPPPQPKGSIPPSLLPPMDEGISGRKNEGTVTLVCGRKHTIGRYSIGYFGIIDGKAIMDVRRDGSFTGEIFASEGEKGHVDIPIERKSITVEVIRAGNKDGEVKITITDT
ncbi:MAG: hypothetical protein PHF60_04415 [Candidatus ainarchaeum sp.]|nr:hypothetical protein [Candidatus ainarchaeum sp.]